MSNQYVNVSKEVKKIEKVLVHQVSKIKSQKIGYLKYCYYLTEEKNIVAVLNLKFKKKC